MTEQLRRGIEFFTQYLLTKIIDCQLSVVSITKEAFDKYCDIFFSDIFFEIVLILFFVLIAISFSLATSTFFLPTLFIDNTGGEDYNF